jgi:hypothetical protein
MNFPLGLTLLAGFIGTTVLIGVLYAIHGAKFAYGDMVRAVGSMATGTEKNSQPVGLAIIYFGGLVFAIFYALLMSVAPVDSVLASAFLGGFVGGAHGIVIALLLMIFFDKEHPLLRFRKAATGVLASYGTIHILYGAIVCGFLKLASSA